MDWEGRVIRYRRRKTGTRCVLRFGEEVAAILRRLPQAGPLFPEWSRISSSDRAARFGRRCRRLGIRGVSLHSCRYAWAERACRAGYPERFAHEALGHKSQAVHRAWARNAQVVLPALEAFEEQAREQNIVPFPKAK